MKALVPRKSNLAMQERNAGFTLVKEQREDNLPHICVCVYVVNMCVYTSTCTQLCMGAFTVQR